jgi:hypothetical protein
MAFGIVEQSATILGAIASSVLVVGLVVPTIAAISGATAIGHGDLMQVSMLVVGFSACAAVAAAVLRGLARQLEDGGAFVAGDQN